MDARPSAPIPPVALLAVALSLAGHPERRAADPPEPDRARPGVLLAERFGPGWQNRWTEETLGPRTTEYEVVDEEGNPVLRATSRRSASALTQRLGAEDGGGLRISWRWKVAGSLAGNEEERSREGDDYAARVFVVFGSGGLASAEAALCYVWAASEPPGARYRSPYAEEVATVVLRSGDERAGRWIPEERDVRADYRSAYGEEPGPPSAVALMVDTDDTSREATAWFDDIVVEEAPREE